MSRRRLLFAAYICSGAAGLIYEVSWARLLTLSMGHTTAAASTVVAAFMGGLALGAAVGGRVATRLTPRAALYGYARSSWWWPASALGIVAELPLLTPLLRLAYADGQAPVCFPRCGWPRRCCCSRCRRRARRHLPDGAALVGARLAGEGHEAGALYAANTVGASLGALAAGFVLLPDTGSVPHDAGRRRGQRARRRCWSCWWRAAAPRWPKHRRVAPPRRRTESGRIEPAAADAGAATAARRGQRRSSGAGRRHSPNLAAAVLALTGFATFTYEIAWTRVFSMIIGPSTYAFSTTLAAVLTGTALGSAGRRQARQPTCAGRRWRCVSRWARPRSPSPGAPRWSAAPLPRLVMRQLVESDQPFASVLLRNGLLLGALILPVAVALGAAFPLALELVGGARRRDRRDGSAWSTPSTPSAASPDR